MSSEQDQARRMAERIARRVSGGSSAEGHTQPKSEVSAELAAVRASLSELQRKISRIEQVVSTGQGDSSSNATTSYSPVQAPQAPSTHSPWLAGINSSYSHPSQEQFGVEEATVTELVDFFEKEKQCSIEPGGKPCDHCAMCSSRGF